MGSGISTTPVVCSHYRSATDVDQDIENYIIHGILKDNEDMQSYSWAFWGLYVWYVEMEAYTNAITKIMDCAMSNNIQGTKYGNDRFYRGTWAGVMEYYQAEYDIVSLWWHPALYTLIVLFTGGSGAIVYLILSIIYMQDY